MARYPGWMAKLEGSFDEVAAWASARREADGSAPALAVLEQEVGERRAKVVESLPPAEFERVPLGAEFQELELAVIQGHLDRTRVHARAGRLRREASGGVGPLTRDEPPLTSTVTRGRRPDLGGERCSPAPRAAASEGLSRGRRSESGTWRASDHDASV